MFTSKLYTKHNFCCIIVFRKAVFSVDFALKTRKIIINFRSIQRLLSLIFNLYLRAFLPLSATFRAENFCVSNKKSYIAYIVANIKGGKKMSFCNNNSTIDRCPGNINGNPMNGLCEKVCIQTTKIFDACMMQTSIDSTVALTNVSPANPTLPLTFVSGSSTSSVGTITALTITPIADRAGLSRVTATISIPVQIAYTDANGVAGTGTSTLSIAQDVVMCVPSGSVISPVIAATVNMTSPRGTYVSDYTFSITSCVTVILSVQAPVNLLVPSYGYCKIPPCTEFSQDACQGVFDLPLFPS